MTGWTRSDQAELDAILWFFLDRYYAHQPCTACWRLNRWCPPLAAAWAAIESWRHTRMLLSKANHLRACRNIEMRPALDAEGNGAHTDIARYQ